MAKFPTTKKQSNAEMGGGRSPVGVPPRVVVKTQAAAEMGGGRAPASASR